MSSVNKNIILETKKLSIGYQQKKENIVVTEDINIELQKGKLVAVLGKNGIGKSTFLRTISKVQKPLAGSVLINNTDLTNYQNNDLASTLSLVLTERLPESQLTVFELIALGRQPYTNWIDKLSENDIDKINIAINQTEIAHLQHKRFYELSDGQLQRVLIARALAQDTPIIILDEPTSHLDLHNTIKIFSLLKELVKTTNKTIIMSSHEVNLSIKLADEIILFKEDKVLSDSPKSLIKAKAFDDLFPSEIINFDSNLSQFIIKNQQ